MKRCTIVHMDYFEGDDRTNYQRMMDGDYYVAEGEEIPNATKRAFELQNRFLELSRTDPAAAHEVLVDLLGSLGEDSFIRPPLAVDLGFNIHMGDRSFVNFNFVALDVAPITIGNDVLIGPNVQLLTPVHPLQPTPRRDKLESAKPITIKDNVWLGGGVIVCPGVTIGENTVVGAGSVVTKNLPANVVAVGNPARVIKELSEEGFDPRLATHPDAVGAAGSGAGSAEPDSAGSERVGLDDAVPDGAELAVG